MFLYFNKKRSKHRLKTFHIGCVTCRYRISEGSKTASSGDLQYIIIAVQYCVRSMWKKSESDCKLICSMIKYKDYAWATNKKHRKIKKNKKHVSY